LKASEKSSNIIVEETEIAHSMNSVAIITARGGSRRIPRKNIRDFLGKPILGYPIAAALESGCFQEVMVSTDDEEIAEIARKFGATVPFMRSAKTSDDFATTADVLKEVLAEYSRRGREFEAACCIYPTAALVTAERLREGMRILAADVTLESVMPVLRFGYPIQRALKIENSRLSMISPEYMNSRSQDLMPVYHDAGQWYWFRTAPFLRAGKISGEFCAPVILDEMDAQDIDNEDDWRLAEMKYCLRKEMR
jgi:N-acylneuraminate cytidylyltransferase